LNRLQSGSLRNTGTDAAYKVKVKLLPQYPFSSDGSVRYVEKLEPGKNAPIELSLDIDKDATPGEYSLDMLLDFEDAQGKSLQDTANVSFVVLRKSLFRAVFIDYWVVWIIVAVLAAVIIKKKKGKKKK